MFSKLKGGFYKFKNTINIVYNCVHTPTDSIYITKIWTLIKVR